MDYLTAIDRRCSRRRYLDIPIEKELVRSLNMRIAEYNEESGLHMQLVLNDSRAFEGFKVSYGIFKGVQNYIALIGKTGDPDRMEKEGYFGEKLVLEATDMGLATCWIGTSYDKRFCSCEISPDESLDLVIAIGHSEKRQGFREKMMRSIMHRNAKTADSIISVDGETPDWFQKGIDAVRKAPTARNLMPFVFSYKDGKMIVKANGNHERIMVDIGIAKLHFEIGAGGGRWTIGDNAQYHRNQ